MKKICLFLLYATSSLLWGQTFGNEQLLKRLDLTDDQIASVLAIEEEFRLLKQEAQVEQNYYKAQLERLLFRADPDMDKVEEVLRNSLEWKLRESLADITRRTDIRRIVGEEAWARMVRTASEIRRRNADISD